MPETVRRLLQRYNLWRWRRAVTNALALHRRGEARSDGLTLVTARQSIEICWRARAAHPWDCHPDGDIPPSALTAQVLQDTEAALLRLFEAMPGTESIELKVLDRDCDRLIIEGRVFRRDFQEILSSPVQSVRMRLKRLGLREYLPAANDGKTASI